jgi:hypothetical protein
LPEPCPLFELDPLLELDPLPDPELLSALAPPPEPEAATEAMPDEAFTKVPFRTNPKPATAVVANRQTSASVNAYSVKPSPSTPRHNLFQNLNIRILFSFPSIREQPLPAWNRLLDCKSRLAAPFTWRSYPRIQPKDNSTQVPAY